MMQAEQAPRRSVWRTVLAWLQALDEAAAFGHDDLRDRRIDALTSQIAELRIAVANLRDGLPSR